MDGGGEWAGPCSDVAMAPEVTRSCIVVDSNSATMVNEEEEEEEEEDVVASDINNVGYRAETRANTANRCDSNGAGPDGVAFAAVSVVGVAVAVIRRGCVRNNCSPVNNACLTTLCASFA